MKFACITLFPEMFQAITDYGVTSRAVKNGLIEVSLINPRDFTTDKHRTVDDRPYGGGPGMLMMVEPLEKAIVHAKYQLSQGEQEVKVVYLSPQGQTLNVSQCQKLGQHTNLVLLCGRYEGIDERIIESHVDYEISLGDFVLSGGEIAAMALIDAIARTIPGVLGHQSSAEEDSFADGLLDCPHYTRPEELHGRKVPEVLLSGNHAEINRWRLKQQLGRTWLRRPELLQMKTLTAEQVELLKEFKAEHKD